MSAVQIDWEAWEGAKPMPAEGPESVQQLTGEALAGVRSTHEKAPSSCVSSGDTLVYAYEDEEGNLCVYDCTIRRHGMVRQ